MDSPRRKETRVSVPPLRGAVDRNPSHGIITHGNSNTRRCRLQATLPRLGCRLPAASRPLGCRLPAASWPLDCRLPAALQHSGCRLPRGPIGHGQRPVALQSLVADCRPHCALWVADCLALSLVLIAGCTSHALIYVDLRKFMAMPIAGHFAASGPLPFPPLCRGQSATQMPQSGR